MADGTINLRTRSCKTCEIEFSYPVGKGNDRVHCGPKCRADYRRSGLLPKSKWSKCANVDCARTVRAKGSTLCNHHYSLDLKERAGFCLVHQCRNKATRTSGTLCEVHYYRKRRTGSYDERAVLARYDSKRGYVALLRADHPMSRSNGRVYEHRYVAYEENGGVCPQCFWCAKELTWGTAVIDHFNEIKHDNDPSNLLVTCNPCNMARGSMKPFIRGMRQEALRVFVESLAFMRCEEVAFVKK